MYAADKTTPAAKRIANGVQWLVGFVVLGVSVCFVPVQARDGNPDGAKVYLTFCAGCHGFDGLATYPPAPSFALGERLKRGDHALLQNLLQGRNAMPPWQDKLSEHRLRSTIAYLHTMNARWSAGLAPRTRPIPPTHYRFRPVGSMAPYLWYFPQR